MPQRPARPPLATVPTAAARPGRALRPLLPGLALALLVLGGPARAQGQPPAGHGAPANVVHLQAEAQIEVPQDWLTITLQAVREGSDAAAVQGGLKQALDGALKQARGAAQGEALQVRTGGFHLGPRYGKEGRIVGWQGQAELVLEGRDAALIAATAGRLNGLNVIGVQPSISRTAALRHEAEASAQAIAAFRQKAADTAQAFGFSGYALREVRIGNGGAQPPQPLFRRAEMAMAASADAPVPVEAGKGQIAVSVSGSVQLLK